MSRTLQQLQPLFRAIMEKLSDEGGYFLKPELFGLEDFQVEDGMTLDGLPVFHVATASNPAAKGQTKSLSQEVEELFTGHLKRIAQRDKLEIEFPEDLWLIAAKDADTLRTAMQTLAKELGVDVGKPSPTQGR